MDLVKRVLIVGGISAGMGLLYQVCSSRECIEQQEVSMHENKAKAATAEQVRYQSAYRQRSLFYLKEDDLLLKEEAADQISRLTQLQNILDKDDPMLFADDGYQKAYAQAALSLYEYCQKLDDNTAFNESEELRSKFRELLYQVPTYAWKLKKSVIFPEEQEVFSFNKEEELNHDDVVVFCPQAQCPDYDIEKTFNLVCGSALASLPCDATNQQAMEDWTFAQVLISSDSEQLKELLGNCVYDRVFIAKSLAPHLDGYSDLEEKFDSAIEQEVLEQEKMEEEDYPSFPPRGPYLIYP